MADSSYELVEIRFDTRHPELTDVYVYIETKGDSPHMIQGWHHKTYPATMTTGAVHAKLMGSQEDNPIFWPRRSPPEVRTSEAGQLAHALLTWDMGMDPTQPGWAYWEGLRMLAEGVIGEREQQ
jgi:hypothetical protein